MVGPGPFLSFLITSFETRLSLASFKFLLYQMSCCCSYCYDKGSLGRGGSIVAHDSQGYDPSWDGKHDDREAWREGCSWTHLTWSGSRERSAGVFTHSQPWLSWKRFVEQAGLKPTAIRLPLASPNAAITGLCHHTWLIPPVFHSRSIK